ncbi:vesicle protein sorting-associated [Vairimorpha apis BRL 01]|uniref:Vesicle protein sorting-associated n=1 Tax=Vairimorpha apis BRL 01 TaxID=1037528 RepID=T0L7X5_9MICR|nr:vesicle protein sorting-associated [Vairimorpha apis BRL 01]
MLRDLQKSRILSFLKLHENPWKILIIDDRTQQIISPLIKIKELREMGITSYFLISNKRYKIGNTPAIYFISSIMDIPKDIYEDLYSEYYIHCVNTIKRKDLEKVAINLSKQGLGLKIKCVYDQFIDFVSLQDDFFSFEIKNSFLEINNTDMWRQFVFCLMSIFVTLESIPLIFSTDEVSRNVGKMLSDKIKGTDIIKKQVKRPILILVNRNYDVFTPIQHVWSYSALMNDLLGLESNKIKIKDKIYDLDPSDPLWKDNRNEYFPLVVEKVEKALLEYKKEMALRSIDTKSDKKAIQKTLEKAPELAKKNESVNAHISICLEMVDIIKNRNIDEFYKIEKSGYNDEELMSISEKGDQSDILRFALNIINSKDGDLAEAMLKKRNVKTNIINFFKQFRPKTTIEKSTLSNVVSSIMGNVQKFLPLKEKSPISDLLENVYYSIKSQNYNDYDVIDPIDGNLLRINDVSCLVVCVLGGCTYQDLKTLKILEEKLKIPIIYGGTEVLNSKNFLDQVECLMKK